MTPAEQAYLIQDQELLVVVQTLQHFEPELLRTKFVIVTDHQALLYYNSKRFLSTHQVHWANFLANFDIIWQYHPGKDNIVADALSHKTTKLPTIKAHKHKERNLTLINQEQFQPHIAAVTKNDIPHGSDLVNLILEENQKQDLGKHNNKVVMLETTADRKIFLHTTLTHKAHELVIYTYGGLNKTAEAIHHLYYWKGLQQDVKQYIRNCWQCGHNKIHQDKTPGLLHPLPVPNHMWEQVVVDSKDMPHDNKGYDYIWVFVYKFSHLITTLAGQKNDTAETLAKRYYNHLYHFLGLPDS